jgi:hypothetical protein
MNKPINHITAEEAKVLKEEFFAKIFKGTPIIDYHLRSYLAVDELTALCHFNTCNEFFITLRATRHVTRGTSVGFKISVSRPTEIADEPLEFMMSTSADILKHDFSDKDHLKITIDDVHDAICEDLALFEKENYA